VAVPAAADDPTPGNDSATASDTLTPVADLVISMSDGQTTAVPGSLYYPFVLVARRAGCTRCRPVGCPQAEVVRHPDLATPLIRTGAALSFRNSWMTSFGAAGIDRLVWQPMPPGAPDTGVPSERPRIS
jgi:hypothetical protein